MQNVYTGPAEALLKAAEGLQAEREASLACSKDVPGGEGHGGGDGLPQGHNDRVQGVVGRYLVAGAEEVCPARFPLSSFCLSFVLAFTFVFAFHDGEARGGSGTPDRGTLSHRSSSSRVVLSFLRLSFVIHFLYKNLLNGTGQVA